MGMPLVRVCDALTKAPNLAGASTCSWLEVCLRADSEEVDRHVLDCCRGRIESTVDAELSEAHNQQAHEEGAQSPGWLGCRDLRFNSTNRPCSFRSQSPEVYNAVFHAEPPMPMKLSMQVFAQVLSTVKCRGGTDCMFNIILFENI